MKRLLVMILWFAQVAACSDENSATPCATDFEQPCTCASGATGQIDCSNRCVCESVVDMSTSEDAGVVSDMTVLTDASDTSMDMFEADTGDDMSADMSGDLSVDGGESDMSTATGPGDCQTDGDCPDGVCRPVADEPLSWRVCVNLVEDPTVCDESGLTLDECCKSDDCTDQQADGQCTRGPIFYCGGAAPTPANVCIYADCGSDSDCTNEGVGVCVDAGAWGEPNNRCVYGDCRVDADCSARSGGECRPFFGSCANRFGGLFCTYDDSTCRVDSDCPPDGGFGQPYCAPGEDGVTTCESFLPPP